MFTEEEIKAMEAAEQTNTMTAAEVTGRETGDEHAMSSGCAWG